MRVALLFEYASLNGGERSWLATVPYLKSCGVQLCAIAPSAGPLAESLLASGVELVPWPDGVRDAAGCKRPQDQLRSQIRRTITTCHVDLIHANSLSMSRTLGPVGRDLDLPCLGHLRDILRLNATVIRDLNQNRRLIAVSDATRCYHVQQGLESSRTFVVHNGVDIGDFAPGEATGSLHRELGVGDRARMILSIGQIGFRKGLETGIEVLRPLFAADASLHWIVVGQRFSKKREAIEYESRLVRASSLPPFRGRVHWLGARDDVASLLREATLLLHLAKQEPFGRVLLEAAATGIGIVATDVGGTAEIFGAKPKPPTDRLTCDSAFLVDDDDHESVRSAILTLLSDQRLARRLGEKARQRVTTQFSAEQSAHDLHRHYREVVA